ncbi:hypothetical protein LSH36_258g05079 [Paralvinella palmiformis]|uniref:Uncharacterized protein n=1 Tax=Paralvinella palmiformis TaxID=53620 RepID=A0AAD9JLB6_9ANNE|nr:hypothetical protein LSH36_258g05079 [Paralvinella palmiformis]
MAWISRNPLMRHILLLAVAILCLLLVTISLMIQTESVHRRRVRLVRYRNERKFHEYEDEFNGEIRKLDWRPIVETPGNTPITSLTVQSAAYRKSDDSQVTESSDEKRPKCTGSLLTLFTTMKNTDSRSTIHGNTLLNWASLIPDITPVLFVENNTNMQWIGQAERSGWHIRNVSMWNQGIPILKYMFLDVLKDYSSPFYGYANADILFDRTLIANLKAFTSYENYSSKLFIIGKRWNLNVSDSDFQLIDASNLTKLSELGRKNGSQFTTNAQDYFIATRSGFPWHQIPDFVVGRAGYDNWLVVKAQDWNLTVVDSSYTIMAIHQTGLDGNRAGWAEQDHRCINREIIGKFNYTRGHTKCVPYISYVDLSGEIKIFRRPKIARDCSTKYRRIKYQPLMGCI